MSALSADAPRSLAPCRPSRLLLRRPSYQTSSLAAPGHPDPDLLALKSEIIERDRHWTATFRSIDKAPDAYVEPPKPTEPPRPDVANEEWVQLLRKKTIEDRAAAPCRKPSHTRSPSKNGSKSARAGEFNADSPLLKRPRRQRPTLPRRSATAGRHASDNARWSHLQGEICSRPLQGRL
jgi:hypothetical protein